MGLSLKISQPASAEPGYLKAPSFKVELGGVDISDQLESVRIFFGKEGGLPEAILSIRVDSLEVDAETITALEAWLPQPKEI